MTQSGQTGRIFVGREWEMAGLRAAIDDTVTGAGRIVMLAGEPGFGKTRMAEELTSYAESIKLKCGGGRVTSNKALLLIVCGSNPFVPTSYGPNPDPYPPRWVPERQTSRQSSQRCSTSCPTWSRHRPLSLNRHASVSSTRFPNFSRKSPSLSQ